MTSKLRLKLTDRIRRNYTGMLGRYRFVDGVSTEEIPFNERIRIAANFGVVEIDADGNELDNPSPAVSTLAGAKERASLVQLPRQTEEEKATENATIILGVEEKVILLTPNAIENVASNHGIAGLREIAGSWNVRSKSIPVLMQMIIDAQAAYIEKKREQLKAKGISKEEIELLLTPSDVVPTFEKSLKTSKETAPVASAEPAPAQDSTPTTDTIQVAAETGNLAAALTIDQVTSETA